MWARAPIEAPMDSHRCHQFEIIIVDDNSPDGTQEVVRKLQLAYGKERVVRCQLSTLQVCM